jgi:Icc-related predicted phosphoesterase/DNA polymerase III delta prime subunit
LAYKDVEMSTISWIHISDIHIRSSEEYLENYNSEIVLKALWDDIKSRKNIDSRLDRLDFAIVTGDLAWSGGDERAVDEYDEVLKRVISPLSETAHLDITKLFIVPGNHDVARSKVDAEARKIESRLQDPNRIRELFVDPSFENDKKAILSRLDNYCKFVKDCLGHIPLDVATCSYSTRLDVADRGVSVRILGLNSAWLSYGGDRDKENIALGEPIVRKLLGQQDDESLTIALVHHPFRDAGVLYKSIEKTTLKQISGSTNFLLSGHVHESNVTSKLTAQGPLIEIVAGSIYENREWSSNSYNYVCFDTQKRNGEIFLRRYFDKGSKGPEFMKDIVSTGEEKDGVVPIVLMNDITESQALSGKVDDDVKEEERHLQAVVREQMKELNRRPLLSESHPDRDSIDFLFPDVYVDPLVSPRKHPQDSPVALSEWLDKFFSDGMKLLLIGPPGTGKTTSLINIHHQLAEDYMKHVRSVLPVYYEARSHDWSARLELSNIEEFLSVMVASLTENRGLRRLDSGSATVLIDALDEAFPSVYQEMGTIDLDKLDLSFPHIATCRSDFFIRNLENAEFCGRYDEILALEPWSIDREVTDFVTGYFAKRGGKHSEERTRQFLQAVESAAQNQSIPITPLAVTTYLFLWLYDKHDIETNPISSFASLLGRFSLLWARREVATGLSVFRDARSLFSAYGCIAWLLYLNRERPPLKMRDLALSLKEKTGLSAVELETDRGILSILRTKKEMAENGEVLVVSLVHEALYEYMLANRLTRALMSKGRDEEILDELMGLSVNQFARQILSALGPGEKKEIIKTLRGKYLALIGRDMGPVSVGRRILRGVFGKVPYSLRGGDASIIRRLNLCYFWGRLESEIGGGLIKKLYRDITSGKITEHEMIRSTIGSGILLTNDAALEKHYLASISDDSSLDKCNRSYHRIYYGDAGYRDPHSLLEDKFIAGQDDWPKTRQAIVFRLNSKNNRALALRGLDLVTFRRLCETRGRPNLRSEEILILRECVKDLGGLPVTKTQIIRNEHARLLKLLSL